MALLNLCGLIHFHPAHNKFAVIRASTGETIKLKWATRCSLGLESLQETQSHVVGPLDRSSEKLILSSTGADEESSLTIGIIGFGALGRFVAKAFQRQGHDIAATSRSDYSGYCQQHEIKFFKHLNDLCETQPDVLLLCNSIPSTESVVGRIPFHKLKTDTIIADMLPVKQFPRDLLMEKVPSGFGILCTHPMIGEVTGDSSWRGSRFVYDKVRITKNSIQERICIKLLNVFEEEGFRMVEMACEIHDQYVAESQFITHFIARILSNMNLQDTPLDTKAYETLKELSQTTVNHSSDIYDGLAMYNGTSIRQIEKLERALGKVKKYLFNKIRDGYRNQIEEAAIEENKGQEY